jgi:glycerol-3-phosphate acyltransferase PlsY
MTAEDLLWMGGAYLAGTLPSAWLVARLRSGAGGRELLAAAGRDAGETDPHILATRYLGAGWSTAAATADVLKAMVFLLAARGPGNLPMPWLALGGLLVVAGHAFPFYAPQMAGRGLAAAAGVYLVLLPWEMTAAGVVIVVGVMARNSGLATTVGMAGVPVVAAWRGQPGSLVVMGGSIFALLMIRRLEGVGRVIRSGVPPARAVLYRCLFDSSGPPASRGEVARRAEVQPPEC